MKIALNLVTRSLLCICLCLNSVQAEDAVALAGLTNNSVPPAQRKMEADLGYDEFNGKTNKIARVFRATPVSVYVIYEGEISGRDIPRKELPLQLMAKYPYDPEQASEFIRHQAKENEARNSALRAASRRREQELQSEVIALEAQNVWDQKERSLLNAQTNGGRRGGSVKTMRLRQLQDKRLEIERRVETLKWQITQVRLQIDRLP